MSDPLWTMSACDLAEGIRRRDFSSVEVTQSVIKRIDAHNPHLNAIVYDYRDEALEAAKAADAKVAAGEDLPLLHGVPATIKENVDMVGKPTPNGVPAFESIIAPDDSPVVRNLLRAGAVIVGRTNVPEFSLRATTDNPLHGRTKNPWSDEASPGGSSGGAGASAAAGFGPIHHGNDIGGSLRFPSYACGVATVKPTLGRVPAFNPSAAAERGMLAQLMSVQGAICREVKDVRLATRVMAQGDARDPWWVPVPFDGAPIDGPIKVAFSKEPHGYPIHADIVSALDRAAGFLSDAGYVVEEVATPSIREPADAWLNVAVAEIKNAFDGLAREHGSPTVQKIFEWYYEMGELVDLAGYAAGVADRTRLTRDWNLFLDEYPLVLTPFLMQPTFPHDYDARGFEQTNDLFQSAIYSFGINYLSLPAGIVPTGLIEGLPAAVQVVGRRFREDLILDALEVIEANEGVLTRQLWERENQR
jgi:amidase